ncbi:MAG: nitroreductase family protein [Mycobacterium sp.]
MVCADTDRVPEIYAPSSIYPAVQNLLLAATDLGYGSCHIRRRPGTGATGAARHAATYGCGLSRAACEDALATTAPTRPRRHLPREVRCRMVIRVIRFISSSDGVFPVNGSNQF